MKLMNNNIPLDRIATWIANDCELEVEPFTHTYYSLYRFCNNMSINKNMSSNLRNIYGVKKQYLEILAKIADDVNPTLTLEGLNLIGEKWA